MLITTMILAKMIQTIGYGALLSVGFYVGRHITNWIDERKILWNKGKMMELGAIAFGEV